MLESGVFFLDLLIRVLELRYAALVGGVELLDVAC